MNWLNEWAKWKVITMYIGLGLLALLFLIFIIYAIVIGISYLYKSHSKKYEYNPLLNDYVRKDKHYGK